MYNKPQPSEFWPPLTAHRIHWEQNHCFHVYEYDPTEDGPEVEIITRILASHPRKFSRLMRLIQRATGWRLRDLLS